ncbi:putative reverse transcriptase domain-containing protein [Tanacetum coccineum]
MRSTGIKRYIDPISGCKIWRTNRKCRIPIDLYPCKVEESMTMKKVGDQTIGVIRRRRIDKEGNVSRFQEYHTSDEEEEELSEHPPYNKYGFVDHPQLQMEDQRNKFAPYPLPPQEGNMNGWLTDDANDSDLESTASNQPMSLTMEDTVTNNLNNGNGNGNGGGNNGCTYKGFVVCGPRDFDRTGGAVALTRWIEKMESVIDNSGCLANQRVKYVASSFIGKDLTLWNTQVQARAAILTAGILTDEAVCSGTLAKAGEKRKERDEASKSESVGKDEKKAKGGQGFVATVHPRKENGNFPKCASLGVYFFSIFKSLVSIIKKLESIRRNFFWGEILEEKKIVWVASDKVISPREQGGIGIGSLKVFNQALLVKWWWRFLLEENVLWRKIIVSIHGKDGGLTMNSSSPYKSGPWYQIMKLKDDISSYGITLPSIFKRKIGNGRTTRFWTDPWLGGPRLCNTFLSNDKLFTVKSMRKYISILHYISNPPTYRWNNALPIKINISSWRNFLERLPTRANLDQRGIDLHSTYCHVCDNDIEMEVHLFISCEVAKEVWHKVLKW